ncbi:MAG: bifunctional phosphoribosylaminoimidazolecarboxamide formyltransferase/IMP cyclohydrolase [Lentimicrobiaceae bacterium]|nr:bifunctional phosphoribosylaminoimidazolecarboxamide formyltransferase/IMP cyclohydrolase [Lentimicrobiaceae bacterium]
MNDLRKIERALISVFYKDGLEPVVKKLQSLGVQIISTGGTYDFITSLDIPAEKVESLTEYPSILGGRVKTLHPAVFGGILARRNVATDLQEIHQYAIPYIDLVIVDLYPFAEMLQKTQDEAEIIEKIDIGGISLIRAAAKNYEDVVIVPSPIYYPELLHLLDTKQGATNINDRKTFAARAFRVSSEYDTMIHRYFEPENDEIPFNRYLTQPVHLRYGENPHQKGTFYGNMGEVFEQLHGKELSYNNLMDVDAALHLIHDFEEPTFAIIKHTNACGIASRQLLVDAWKDALACDPVSAFGGILVTNKPIDNETALEISKLFFEVIIAPGYQKNALETLQSRKNRIILQTCKFSLSDRMFRSALNGMIVQDKDTKVESPVEMVTVTKLAPAPEQYDDLIFANIIVKHSKSNAIVLVKNRQLLASGVGQTSRVDAVKQAIAKAEIFGFTLQGAVMASDAYFPFADSVEIAKNAGITAVIQPGGSIRDAESIDYCNNHGISMVFTGFRHFKH